MKNTDKTSEYSSLRERAIVAGCNDYLSKPIRKAKLTEVLLKYLKDEPSPKRH